MIALQQMAIFFVMMLVGVIARRQDIITQNTRGQLSKLVVNLACPALVLTGAIKAEEKMPVQEALFALILAVGLFGIAIVIAQVLPRLMGYSESERRIANLMLVFSNTGFMGIPLVAGIFGNQAIIYVTFFLIPFNVLFYTYGVRTIRAGQSMLGSGSIRQLFNPGVIASLATLALYFSNFTLPRIIADPIVMLGSITAPLAMMLIGSSLIDIKLHEVFLDKRLLIFTVLKMVLIPIAMLLVIKQFISNYYLLGACLVILATPPASMIAMLALMYDESSHYFATKGIAFMTLVSVVTLPIVSLATGIG